MEKGKKELIDSKDKEILKLMKENSSISVNDISKQVGLGTTTLTKRIHRLKEEGFVERKGSKKKGQWIVGRGTFYVEY